MFFIPSLPHWISMKVMVPVRGQHIVLHSIPKGSGFLMICNMLGSWPYVVWCDLQAHIDSSRIFMKEVVTLVYKAKRAVRECVMLLIKNKQNIRPYTPDIIKRINGGFEPSPRVTIFQLFRFIDHWNKCTKLFEAI